MPWPWKAKQNTRKAGEKIPSTREFVLEGGWERRVSGDTLKAGAKGSSHSGQCHTTSTVGLLGTSGFCPDPELHFRPEFFKAGFHIPFPCSGCT